jgi:hypothetical protein
MERRATTPAARRNDEDKTIDVGMASFRKNLARVTHTDCKWIYKCHRGETMLLNHSWTPLRTNCGWEYTWERRAVNN